MKLYLKENVYDAGLARMRWLFDEFPSIVVGFSGGKDSTVALNLALMVAEEKGRLPLPVLFIDQEAEWQSVIDYVREVMNDPRVKPYWLQIPFRIFNATSPSDDWLHCWEPGKRWIRDREPNSIHENVYGTDRFVELFPAFMRHHFPGPAASIIGVRCEESPGRLVGLTSKAVYKGETWGRMDDRKRQHMTFSPLYDWSVTDVWKAIHSHGWKYCALYDAMYQHGVPVAHMRVSNLHHETSLKTLYYVQEIENDTWNRVTERLAGINTVGQMRSSFFAPSELPRAFRTWTEYREYLLEHLIVDDEHRKSFRKLFDSLDDRYDPEIQPQLIKVEIQSILVNDYHGSKLATFTAGFNSYSWRAGRRGGGLSKQIRAKRIAEKLAKERGERSG